MSMPVKRPTLEIALRQISPGDTNYVLDSWRRAAVSTLTRGDSLIARQHIHAAQRALIYQLLHRPGVRVSVAWPQVGDTNDIAGYCVTEPAQGVLHWVSVQQPYRRSHVATRLMVDAFGKRENWPSPVRCSHWTAACKHRVTDGWPLAYDPGVL